MKLAIVGFGLIGSSLARAAQRAYSPDINITAIDPSLDRLNYAVKLGLCDDIATDLSGLPQDCDWVILAAPVAVNLALIDELMTYIGPKTRLTDAGSTKAALVQMLNIKYPNFDRFIPAHPMAGRELSGPEHGLEDLFDKKLVILTPPTAASSTHIKAAEEFYARLGARTLKMDDAQEHDQLMGYVSHLPHLLAFAYVNLAIHDKNETKNYQELTGGGYRDFTRIAASDPIMWRDIFLGNKDNILTQLDAFSAIIDTYRNILSSEDDGALIDLISKAKDERTRLQEIIKG